MVKRGNSTFLTLIPKGDDPLSLVDYRLISLVGCQYKILAKILAERLKVVMPELISENQSAFVDGRQILDGVLMENEVVSWAKSCKKKLTLLKIDFGKAYDCVNWDFLDLVMKQLRFGLVWRLWIKGRLSSSKVSVLVNGSPTSEFNME